MLTQSQQPLKFISLFSGIGGFDLGLERAGIFCVAQVEYDARCWDILAEHWPDVKRFEDVRYVGRDNLPPADLICGGFPCQDVSMADRRAGLAGKRSRLWREFHRIIEELQPGWVVIENVPGLLSSNGGRDMGAILWALGELGYWWAYRVLDAQFFGLAQRRRRVFIVASLGNRTAPAKVLFESEGVPGDFETGGGARPDVTGTFTKNAYAGGADGIVGTQSSNYAKQSGTLYEMENGMLLAHSIGNGQWKEADHAGTLRGSSHGAIPMTGVRRLTPTECCRLQGFPDNWNASQSDSVRYRQLGNAVAVPVAEWIGRRIMALVTEAAHD